MNTFLRHAAIVLWAATTALGAGAASAEGYPDKPVRLVVPFAPGGATDLFARNVAQALTERWGQQILVENRPGASGNIGADAVARAPGDGYTLLMGTSNHAINATLYRKLPYELARDLTPVTNVAQVPLVLVVNPAVRARTVAELVTLAKAKPGSLVYASGSTGTASHLAGEMLESATGIDAIHAPYKGGAPAINDLLGGHVSMMFANMPEVLAHVRAGKLVALAVTSARRHPALPDVATMTESGLTGFEATSWFGLFMPRATPAALLARINEDVVAILDRPEMKARFLEQGAEVVADSPADFEAYVNSEISKWGKLVRQSGAAAD
jgi:tripartite-type tricarboxylate transporter receptor subunit TctC